MTSPVDRGRPPRVIGVLDVGTAKICCLIATATDQPRLLGLGHQRSRGIKAGIVVDLDEAEQVIRATVAQAERQAGVTLDEVHVSIAGGQLLSSHFAATAEVANGVVGPSDIARVLEGARSYCERDGRALIHMNRIAYRLDDYAGVSDPRGMAGRILAGDMHAVTADDGPVRNLALLIERCFLRPVRLTPAGLASARAVTSPEEMRSGVTVIDMGAGTTSIAVIADGHDVFAGALPIGGHHLTFDIANALRTPLAEAERIKVLYGTMVEASSDERDIVTYPRTHESETELYQTTRAQIRALLRPRVESLLSQAMEKLVVSGLEAYGGGRIVLTGGAAQLVGLPMFAGRFLASSVRIATPRPLAGMNPSSCTPAFATAIGLVAASANPATLAPVEPRLATANSG
ncbi:MAG: cell division protein FtsA, partial [Hyphomicrobiaceae bacterium]